MVVEGPVFLILGSMRKDYLTETTSLAAKSKHQSKELTRAATS